MICNYMQQKFLKFPERKRADDEQSNHEISFYLPAVIGAKRGHLDRGVCIGLFRRIDSCAIQRKAVLC